MTNRKTIIEVAVFAGLGALAMAGWMRKPQMPNVAGSYANQGMVSQSAAYGNQPAYVSEGMPVSMTDRRMNLDSATRSDGNEGYSTAPCVAPAASVAYNDTYYNDPYYSSNRPVRVTRVSQSAYRSSRLVYSAERPVTRRHGRSAKRSAALVAGSAGVGASVGALAGGGKGAGIGALSGGTAGFIYDRLTHKTHSGF